MADHGYAATSIDSICKATKLAPTAIYWHFGSKEGLLAAIVERTVEQWYTDLALAMKPDAKLGTGSPEDVPPPDLDRFFEVMADSYRRSPQALRLMLRLGLDRRHSDPGVRLAVQSARDRAVELMTLSIEKVLDRDMGPSFQSVHQDLARLLLVLLDGIFVMHEIDDEDRLDSLFSMARTAFLAAALEVVNRALSEAGGQPLTGRVNRAGNNKRGSKS